MRRLQIEQELKQRIAELYIQAAGIEEIQDRLAEELEVIKQDLNEAENSLQNVEEWGVPSA